MSKKRITRLLSIVLLIGALGGGWLTWKAATHASITIEWTTATELNTAGFNVYRADEQGQASVKINATLVPASVDPLQGGIYTVVDPDVEPGKTYTYTLEEIEISGITANAATTTIQAERGGILEGAATAFLLAASLFTFAIGQKFPPALKEPAGGPD